MLHIIKSKHFLLFHLVDELWMNNSKKTNKQNCFFDIKIVKAGTLILGHATGYLHASQTYKLYSCQHMQYLCQNGLSEALNVKQIVKSSQKTLEHVWFAGQLLRLIHNLKCHNSTSNDFMKP